MPFLFYVCPINVSRTDYCLMMYISPSISALESKRKTAASVNYLYLFCFFGPVGEGQSTFDEYRLTYWRHKQNLI